MRAGSVLSQRRWFPRTLLLVGFALAGCGEDGGPGSTQVPLDVPPLNVFREVCVPLAPGQQVLGTSPEGDLWLVGPGAEDGRSAIRVVNPFGAETSAFEVPYRNVVDGQPWDAHRATLIADDRIVAVDDGGTQRVAFPPELGTPRAFCGDPAGDGDAFVLADGVFERTAGQWWRWRPGSADDFGGEVAWISRVDGACRAPDGALWVGVMDEDGAAWRLDDDEVARVDELGVAADVTYAGLGDMTGEDLETDPLGITLLADGVLFEASAGYRAVVFDAGPVDELAATVGTLWARIQDRAYARAEGDVAWSALPDDGARPRSLHPHAAGGIWVTTGDSACHEAVAPRFEVRGLRPREQRLATTADLDIAVEGGVGPLRLIRDGADVSSASMGEDGRFQIPELELGERGSHVLTIEDTGSGQTRTIPYVLRSGDGGTWVDDIEPIFTANCSSGSCHGPDPNDDDRPDLSTFEAWVEWSDTIAVRVGVVGDMPPAEVRTPSWGPDEIETIVAWIEGGMEQGE